ncbi:MAG TPA: glutamate racemase [Gemmatimonadales bacterium]|nr:glutamate racemase [Gemmatimonadales bacterium]
MNRAPIGIFDSGLGGLTVARAIFERLPGDSTIYFGDTARVPYGPKSPATVRRYSHEILGWLLGQRVKAVVVACNTSTAHALDSLRAASTVPVIGVIEPGARAAVRAAPDGPVGVIGTAGTVASGAYERAIQAFAPGTVVHQVACPLFVPLVEEGWFEHPASELIAREYLAPLQQAGVRALVLGCTHYPLLRPLLQRVMGPDVALIDSAEATADEVAAAILDRGLEAPAEHPPEHRYAVSDDAARFMAIGGRFVGGRLSAAEVVELGGA